MKKINDKKLAKKFAKSLTKNLTMYQLKLLILALVDECGFNIVIPCESKDEEPFFYVI